MKILKKDFFQRRAALIAHTVFPNEGGLAGFFAGDIELLRKIAAHWPWFSAALECPEWRPAYSRDDAIELWNAEHAPQK